MPFRIFLCVVTNCPAQSETYVIMEMHHSSMAKVLLRLNLGNLINKFEEEKITPAIICQLSSADFNSLGLHSSQDIMALRTLCTPHRSQPPVKVHQGCGAPQYLIPRDILQTHLEEGFMISEIASMLSVSERTDITDNLISGEIQLLK